MTLIRLPRESGRYLVIGAACAALNNLILIGGDALGLHYAASMLLTVTLVLPVSYLAHACWTFDVPLSWAAFGRYVMGSTTGVGVACVTIWALCGPLRLPMAFAAPLLTLVMVGYNFTMTRWAVRRRHPSQ